MVKIIIWEIAFPSNNTAVMYDDHIIEVFNSETIFKRADVMKEATILFNTRGNRAEPVKPGNIATMCKRLGRLIQNEPQKSRKFGAQKNMGNTTETGQPCMI